MKGRISCGGTTGNAVRFRRVSEKVPSRSSVADLAADHDRALKTEFARPNDILSISKEVLLAYSGAH
jgi:hypothetical protein